MATTFSTSDRYFSILGQQVWAVVFTGVRFGAQAYLTDIGSRLGGLSCMQAATGRAFSSWGGRMLEEGSH